MAAFVAPYVGGGDASSSGMMRWDVEADVGEAAPAWSNASRHRVRAALYDGTLGAGARVRPAGGAASEGWSLVGSVPEFAVVLGLRGGDLAPLAGARKLAQVAGSGGGGGPAPLRNASPGAWPTGPLAPVGGPEASSSGPLAPGASSSGPLTAVGAPAGSSSGRLTGGPAGPMAPGRAPSVGNARPTAAPDGSGRLNIPKLRANVPSTRVAPRTVFLLCVGALAVGMAAWLASG